MGRNYLHHRSGNAINALLAAVGYNFSLLLRWLRFLLLLILTMLAPHSGREPPEIRFFTASVKPPIQKNILTFFAKITV
jgi:hypothetical protein